MKFSLIIPTYNRADLILKTIESVLNQTYSNFEVLIIDDGSSDNSEEVILSIEDPRVIYHKKENGERGAARNYGIKIAKGDYVSFLDSDDLLYDNYFEEASKYIKQTNPDVFFQLFDIKNNEGKTLKNAISRPKNINKTLIFTGNIFACQGAFIKKEIAVQNLFIENREFAGTEDYELWLRINANYKIQCNPVTTSTLIEHDDRSVLNYNAKELIKRQELMIEYLFTNSSTKNYYQPYKNILIANTQAYIAIHLVISGNKKLGFKYLVKTLKRNPSFLFTRKFLAIIKHLLF